MEDPRALLHRTFDSRRLDGGREYGGREYHYRGGIYIFKLGTRTKGKVGELRGGIYIALLASLVSDLESEDDSKSSMDLEMEYTVTWLVDADLVDLSKFSLIFYLE